MTAQPLCLSLLIAVYVVIKMKGVKSLIKVSLRGKVFRILGPNREFEFSPSHEETSPDSQIHYKHFAYPREIGLALLEAEDKKAKALMEWQKHRLAFR
jgi:hypothetical protein